MSLINRETDPATLFATALKAPQDIPSLLAATEADDPIVRRLQQIRQTDAIFLDLAGADTLLSLTQIDTIVNTIREHWHAHGFCIARSGGDTDRWICSTYSHHQPLLYWRSLSIAGGWSYIGIQLHATELGIIRHLIERGSTTPKLVAHDTSIFSQRPNFSDWRVQQDIALGKYRPGPSAFNQSEAKRLLTRLKVQRLVVERMGYYHIVRPTSVNIT